jgi:hypothetical protein
MAIWSFSNHVRHPVQDRINIKGFRMPNLGKQALRLIHWDIAKFLDSLSDMLGRLLTCGFDLMQKRGVVSDCGEHPNVLRCGVLELALWPVGIVAQGVAFLRSLAYSTWEIGASQDVKRTIGKYRT